MTKGKKFYLQINNIFGRLQCFHYVKAFFFLLSLSRLCHRAIIMIWLSWQCQRKYTQTSTRAHTKRHKTKSNIFLSEDICFDYTISTWTIFGWHIRRTTDPIRKYIPRYIRIYFHLIALLFVLFVRYWLLFIDLVEWKREKDEKTYSEWMRWYTEAKTNLGRQQQ